MEISKAIGAPVIDSYAVQDKVQEAEIDPSMILEDELFAVETWEPCVVCGASGNDPHSQMYCDGCDKTVHIFCAGFDVNDAPDVWYCETCHVDIEADAGLPSLRATLRGQPRRQRNANAPSGRRVGGRRNDTSWARVWQEVSRRLDLDLDFPFSDDEPMRDTRTPQQRREFRQWQRRFEVADRQGVSNRLRDIAQTRQPQPQPQPESQEELRAWNAFDKARELHEPEPNTRKRKATDSPASPREPEPEPRKLKRPRLRRPAGAAGSPPAESSHAAAQRGAEGAGATFLSSLLREVENNPSSAGSPGPSSAAHMSPRNSSPARSPGSSGYGSPKMSATPPLSPIAHPRSPPNPLFSPFSPAVASQDLERSSRARSRTRARRREQHDSGYDENYSGSDALSPSRNMSYSAKEEIQRMVKLALRPRYLEKIINKDQYTDINRDISRRMYDLVGDASALADQSARERWQGLAADEVQKAITALTVDASKSD